MTDLDSLIDSKSGWVLDVAYGINDKGQIVGYGSVNGQSHGFILTPISTTTGGSSGGGYIEVLP